MTYRFIEMDLWDMLIANIFTEVFEQQISFEVQKSNWEQQTFK